MCVPRHKNHYSLPPRHNFGPGLKIGAISGIRIDISGMLSFSNIGLLVRKATSGDWSPFNSTILILNDPPPVGDTGTDQLKVGCTPASSMAIFSGAVNLVVSVMVNMPLARAIAPPGTRTFTEPVTLAGKTFAVINVLLLVSNIAVLLPMSASLGPPSPVPIILTIVPTGPLFGLKDFITGGFMLKVRTSPKKPL
jgi:hypothetical protein